MDGLAARPTIELTALELDDKASEDDDSEDANGCDELVPLTEELTRTEELAAIAELAAIEEPVALDKPGAADAADCTEENLAAEAVDWDEIFNWLDEVSDAMLDTGG